MPSSINMVANLKWTKKGENAINPRCTVLSPIGITFDSDTSPMVVLPYMSNGDHKIYIQVKNIFIHTENM